MFEKNFGECFVLLCEYFKGYVSPMKIRLVDKVVEHPQEGKVGDVLLLMVCFIYLIGCK